MTWRWLARLADPPVGSSATGPLATIPLMTPDGAGTGALATWDRDVDRPDGALRVDHRAVDGGASLTWVSLVVLAEGAAVAFDDGAVVGALRRRLAQRWPGLCSTLLVDWATFGGALTAGPDLDSVADDPFARLGPRELLRVPAGALGAIPPPTGPGVTRYGSGNPWPWDRYRGQVS